MRWFAIARSPQSFYHVTGLLGRYLYTFMVTYGFVRSYKPFVSFYIGMKTHHFCVVSDTEQNYYVAVGKRAVSAKQPYRWHHGHANIKRKDIVRRQLVYSRDTRWCRMAYTAA